MIIDFQSVRKQIVAILPCYLPEGGNGCRVLLRSGQELSFKNRVSKVWKDYLMLWGLSDEALEHAYALGTENGKNTPLPLTDQHTFLCLKVRKPLVNGDSAYGYVEHESLTYPEGPAREPLNEVLCCGHRIEIIASNGHLRSLRELAVQAQQAWQKHNRPSRNIMESLLIRDVLILKYKILNFVINSCEAEDEEADERLTELQGNYEDLQIRAADVLNEEPIQPFRKRILRSTRNKKK